MGAGFLGQRQLQIGEPAIELVDRVADPELEVEGDLVVARARRMQPPGSRRRSARKAAIRHSYECLRGRART